MDEHRHVGVGHRAPERIERTVIEVGARDVGPDLHPDMPAPHCTAQFGCSRLRSLQRHLGHAAEAARVFFAHLQHRVVERSRQLGVEASVERVVGHRRHDRQDLHVDAGALHVLQPQRHVERLARQRIGNHTLLAQDGGAGHEQFPFLSLLDGYAAAETAAAHIFDERQGRDVRVRIYDHAASSSGQREAQHHAAHPCGG